MIDIFGQPIAELKDGVPCHHSGCLSHITHPCEGCGRIGGRRLKNYVMNDAQMVEKVAREVLKYDIYSVASQEEYPITSVVYWMGTQRLKAFDPLNDANDTQMVKDKLREMGWSIQIHIAEAGEAEVMLIGLCNRISIKAHDEAHAIMEAACKTVEVK